MASQTNSPTKTMISGVTREERINGINVRIHIPENVPEVIRREKINYLYEILSKKKVK